jgi:hypothetical protein
MNSHRNDKDDGEEMVARIRRWQEAPLFAKVVAGRTTFLEELLDTYDLVERWRMGPRAMPVLETEVAASRGAKTPASLLGILQDIGGTLDLEGASLDYAAVREGLRSRKEAHCRWAWRYLTTSAAALACGVASYGLYRHSGAQYPAFMLGVGLTAAAVAGNIHYSISMCKRNSWWWGDNEYRAYVRLEDRAREVDTLVDSYRHLLGPPSSIQG